MARNLSAILAVVAIGTWLMLSAVSAQQGAPTAAGGPGSPSAEILARGRYMCGLTGFVADRRPIIWRQTLGTLSDYALR